MTRIAIINSSSFGKYFPQHIQALEKLGDVERMDLRSTMEGAELAQALQGYDIIVAGVTPFYTQEFFAHNDSVKLITRHGIGYNNVDIQAAKQRGCAVAIVPPLVERDAVAENAVANLMAAMRMTVPACEAAQNSRWTERASFMGYNITGKTVGVIGCGNIGSRAAEIFKYGFNMRLLVNDPALDEAWAQKHGAEACSVDELLAQSDIISLHASLNESSYHMLNESAFAKMKRGVYITNTARGDLIDEQALLKALDSGIVNALATDVMHEEPAPDDHPYFAHERILVTPHTSAYTFECIQGMGDKCVEDAQNYLQGKTIRNTLT